MQRDRGVTTRDSRTVSQKTRRKHHEHGRATCARVAYCKENTLKAGQAQFTAGFLKGRIDLLKRYWSKFYRDHQVLMADPEAAQTPYLSDDVYSTTELQYSTALGHVHNEQRRINSEPERGTATVSVIAPPRSTHLPKIALPSFSGNLDEWETYRDLCRSLIHSDQTLTPVQK